MIDRNEVLDHIFRETKIIYPPQQSLATFGITNIHYYLACQIMDRPNKVRLREGNVTAERPRIVPPGGLKDIFDGFGRQGKEFGGIFKERYSDKLRILEYKFKNKYLKSRIFTGNINNVTRSISKDTKSENEPLTAVIKGVDDYWQVSLMKFIVDIVTKSFYSNIMELEERGFFKEKERVGFTRAEIENLFRIVRKDRGKINELGDKLVRYGLFEEYQDRFFQLLKD